MGELEDAVMTRVWQWNRPVTVREVLEDLQQERSIAYTTVMTVMDNLHQKGWVRREVDGRAYRYTAVSTRAAYAAALMNDAGIIRNRLKINSAVCDWPILLVARAMNE